MRWVLIKCSEYTDISMWGHWEAVTNRSVTVTPAHGVLMSHLLSQGFVMRKYAAALGLL